MERSCWTGISVHLAEQIVELEKAIDEAVSQTSPEIRLVIEAALGPISIALTSQAI